METIKVLLQNTGGLTAVGASLFVRTAIGFQSLILVKYNNREADGKKVLGILALEAPRGVEIEILAEGPDEVQAISTLKQLIEKNLFE